MKQKAYFLVILLFLSLQIQVNAAAERDVKVTSVPKAVQEERPPRPSEDQDAESLRSMQEHAEKKKKFIKELETEAGQFKLSLDATQDPEEKKKKEQSFRESRKLKIETFLAEEKRREEMKKDIDEAKQKAGMASR